MRYTTQGIIGGISAVIGYITGYSELLGLLLLCMCCDFVTGVAKAFIQCKLSSRRCSIGVLKKTLILQVTILVHYFALIANEPQIECMVLWFWVAVEMLSILENMTDCGLPIPKRLKNALIQIKGGEDDN